MATRQVTVDPMTRIEGHLRFTTRVEDGVVTDARCSAEMFRGIEKALIGHDARVAQQVTQRVCGVCPYAHAEAAALALEAAMGIRPTATGQILRNLIVGAYQLQDYLLHFYTLSALDFIDITAVLDYRGGDATLLTLRDWVKAELASGKVFPATPFLPRYEAAYSRNQDLNLSAIRNYAQAFTVMAELHKMVAIFGAKAPHPVTIEAGGVTVRPSFADIARYRALLNRTEAFISEAYANDLIGVAGEFPGYFDEGRGYGNLLSFPYFPAADGDRHSFAGGASIGGRFEPLELTAITEDHRYSFYRNRPEAGVRPLAGGPLEPLGLAEYQQEKQREDGKYSWSRAPRYRGEVMEVGPAARVVNTYRSGSNPELNTLVDSLNRKLGIGLANYPTVLGRHLSRYVCAMITLQRLREDLEQLTPGELGYLERDVPRNASDIGLTEATRGALGHWLETDAKGYIRRYEMVVPTTWNISPRDASGRPGAVERMLIGTRLRDPANPIELTRIVRSTDPCLACSVH